MQILPLPRDLADDMAEKVVRLWRECGLVRPWNDSHADLARAVAGPCSAVLVAVDGDAPREGVIAGTVMVGHDGHRGWVYYLAVAADRRAQGVGRDLMAAAEEWLRRSGASKVQLMVRSDNADVIAFYRRLGYSDQGVTTLGRFLDPELEAWRRSAVQSS